MSRLYRLALAYFISAGRARESGALSAMDSEAGQTLDAEVALDSEVEAAAVSR